MFQYVGRNQPIHRFVREWQLVRLDDFVFKMALVGFVFIFRNSKHVIAVIEHDIFLKLVFYMLKMLAGANADFDNDRIARAGFDKSLYGLMTSSHKVTLSIIPVIQLAIERGKSSLPFCPTRIFAHFYFALQLLQSF